jgi:hypothetical protein
MSVGYVIPDVSQDVILSVLEIDDDIVVLDNNDNYAISMPINPRYSLKKRIGLSQAINVPPDTVQQGGGKSSITLHKTEDADNSWFSQTAASINHPEIILSKILDLLGSHGIDANWWCDATDEEYFMLGEAYESNKE